MNRFKQETNRIRKSKAAVSPNMWVAMFRPQMCQLLWYMSTISWMKSQTYDYTQCRGFKSGCNYFMRRTVWNHWDLRLARVAEIFQLHPFQHHFWPCQSKRCHRNNRKSFSTECKEKEDSVCSAIFHPNVQQTVVVSHMLEHHNFMFPVLILIFYMVNSVFYKTASPQAFFPSHLR